ncbi:hypothetical protein [Dactylosporangium salmoneum]|uniref:Uncharacterized protein n=1 Tax=Dactylosporangium salmoneum TaxID=53361 RepID=A0ABP5TYE2_9ACTN
MIADGIALDTDDVGDMPVGAQRTWEWRALDAFPRASWSQGTRWRRMLSSRSRYLVHAIERGDGLIAECVADYLIHHLAIERGRDEVDDALRDPDHPSHGIPAYPDDYAWHRLPYSSRLGDLDASRSAPNYIRSLHRTYLATKRRPQLWFIVVNVSTSTASTAPMNRPDLGNRLDDA